VGISETLWRPCGSIQFVPFYLRRTLLLQYLDDGEA
jgi:hypothetical protein